MNKSDTISSLAAALHKAQSQVEFAKKDAVNPHFNSRYADLWRIWQAAKPVLVDNGLSILQTFEKSDGETVTVVTTLLHVSGEWVSSALTLKPTKPDPQGIGSAITYGRRYGLSSILGIVADEDDDGNQASTQTAKKASTPIGTLVVPLPKGWDKWYNDERGDYMATQGSEPLKQWFESLSVQSKKELAQKKDGWKATAAEADAKKGSA